SRADRIGPTPLRRSTSRTNPVVTTPATAPTAATGGHRSNGGLYSGIWTPSASKPSGHQRRRSLDQCSREPPNANPARTASRTGANKPSTRQVPPSYHLVPAAPANTIATRLRL